MADSIINNVDKTAYLAVMGKSAADFNWGSMFPHHRPSAADGIKEPIPGFLVGGPNPGEQDGVKLSSKVPDESYEDAEEGYAINEIAINWNAPLVYLVNAIEAIQK